MFFEGLFFGLMLQIAIGPVCLSVLLLSLSKGFREGMKMSLGVAVVDGLYIIASLLGMAALLKIDILNKVVLSVGGFVLIYFGLSYFKKQGKNDTVIKQADRNSFLYGIKLTLTNPLTILFWSGVFGSLMASNKLSGAASILAYSAGCVMATVLFLGLISAGGKYASKLLNPKIIKVMGYGVGLYLVYFGLSMFTKLKN
ncbi:leucine efflux protein [Oxobacter pfennigii]|uniref:Leucine efflux protein n=1 Tax=Oxobacter pfennigii TaxID=36849 RepID=A0A0P8W9I9_9CLOT|nr:LysE family transporter [Oxobacter pfennigii]KPU45305.1 leucine efflux protein [Oxobacter pfennigii]